jgi:hypothetical protein
MVVDRILTGFVSLELTSFDLEPILATFSMNPYLRITFQWTVKVLKWAKNREFSQLSSIVGGAGIEPATFGL